MTPTQWWISLFEGSIGSILGLMGLFGVFWLTRRHDLARDAAADAMEHNRVAQQRTAESVAKVVDAASRLRYSSGNDSLSSDHLSEALSHQLTMFSVVEVVDHRDAADWAHWQSGEVLKCTGPEVDIRAATWQAGFISGALRSWAARGYPDDLLKAPPGPDKKRANAVPPGAMTERNIRTAARAVAKLANAGSIEPDEYETAFKDALLAAAKADGEVSGGSALPDAVARTGPQRSEDRTAAERGEAAP